MSVDWSAGRYEHAAAELAPVAQALVQRAAPEPGERVLDLACGTGSVALVAAARGGRVIGVDAAPRLLGVADEHARARGVVLDLREGDLLALPVSDDSVDVVISSFGLIFAADPGRALAEVARVLAPRGRAYLSAWIPAGGIDAMFVALARVIASAGQAPRPPRFAWFDPEAIRPIVAGCGLELVASERAKLAIRASSPEAYVDAGAEHPMALALAGPLARAGAAAQAREAMIAALREANEDPSALLIHSPYAVHELRAVS